MATVGPYLIFIVLIVLLCLWLLYAAIASFHYDLMAKGRMLLMILGVIGIVSLLVFYFTYVLGSPLPVSEAP